MMHLVWGRTPAFKGQEKFIFLYLFGKYFIYFLFYLLFYFIYLFFVFDLFEKYPEITLLLVRDIHISLAPKRKSDLPVPADSVSGEALLPGSR